VVVSVAKATSVSNALLCGLCGYDELDVAIQEMEQCDELSEVLAGDRGVKQAIELRYGGVKSASKLTTTELRAVHSLGRFNSEFVGKQLGQVSGVLVVFECVLNVNGAFGARFKDKGDPFAGEFPVDNGGNDSVLDRGLRVKLDERERESPSRTSQELELSFSIVDGNAAKFHKTPSIRRE
jgi:hypothetical protein